MKSKNQFFRLSLLVVTLLFTQFATAQERKVSGTVTDSKNEPLIGVNVTVKGADTFGAITDLDGNYSLDVPSDAVLVASYIGYATKEVKVNGSVVNIVLEEDAQDTV